MPDNNNNQQDLSTLLNLLPTNFQQNLPHWIQVAGVIIGGLGYGYQKMAAQYPDLLNQVNGASTYLSMAGAAIVLSGIILNKGNAKQLITGAKAAASSPPARADGSYDATHTLSCGVQQAISSGDFALAHKVTSVLKEHEESKTHSDECCPQPPMEGGN